MKKRFNSQPFLFAFLLGCSSQSPETPKAEEQPAPAPKAAETGSDCTWQVSSVTPGWTAYKFTEKAPVGGTFNKHVLSGNDAKKTFTDSLNGVEVNIDPKSVESNNPARNITIAEKFFAIFLSPESINGKIVAVNGDDKKGTIDLKLAMNGQEKVLNFPYSVSDKGELKAEKSIDMLDFGLKPAYDSIHKACEGLHIGKDGISKTWTEVLLKIDANLKKTCK